MNMPLARLFDLNVGQKKIKVPRIVEKKGI